MNIILSKLLVERILHIYIRNVFILKYSTNINMALKQETQIIELPIYKGGNYFHKGGNYFHKGGNYFHKGGINIKKEQFIIRRAKNKNSKSKRKSNNRTTKKHRSKKHKSLPN